MTRDEMRFKVFLGSAVLHSTLGTCPRLRTACAIVNKKRLRGMGYNGSVSGTPHCEDEGHLMVDGHCVRTRHGEVNAITNTDRKDLRGGQALIIATPCLDCVKDLIEEGVTEIDYVGSYQNAKGKQHIEELAQQKGVIFRQHDIDWRDFFQDMFDIFTREGGILANAGYRLQIIKIFDSELKREEER